MTQLSHTLDASLLVRDHVGDYRPATPCEVLQAAQDLLAAQLHGTEMLGSPELVRKYLRMKLGGLAHEVFAVLMLDTQNRLLCYREIFRGTISETAVYPREVVKEALAANAAATMLIHNHPSGRPDPSQADITLTSRLKAALALVDVRVLDHLVVTSGTVFSFAEHGMM